MECLAKKGFCWDSRLTSLLCRLAMPPMVLARGASGGRRLSPAGTSTTSSPSTKWSRAVRGSPSALYARSTGTDMPSASCIRSSTPAKSPLRAGAGSFSPPPRGRPRRLKVTTGSCVERLLPLRCTRTEHVLTLGVDNASRECSLAFRLLGVAAEAGGGGRRGVALTGRRYPGTLEGAEAGRRLDFAFLRRAAGAEPCGAGLPATLKASSVARAAEANARE
mmetsp:Transcript_9341/g.30736  ORF Transcript_9341/g.30736 Transcript_9341/m.30736 type:complete len:221 (+) Transcript_9341:342-1004(+)